MTIEELITVDYANPQDTWLLRQLHLQTIKDLRAWLRSKDAGCAFPTDLKETLVNAVYQRIKENRPWTA